MGMCHLGILVVTQDYSLHLIMFSTPPQGSLIANMFLGFIILKKRYAITVMHVTPSIIELH